LTALRVRKAAAARRRIAGSGYSSAASKPGISDFACNCQMLGTRSVTVNLRCDRCMYIVTYFCDQTIKFARGRGNSRRPDFYKNTPVRCYSDRGAGFTYCTLSSGFERLPRVFDIFQRLMPEVGIVQFGVMSAPGQQ